MPARLSWMKPFSRSDETVLKQGSGYPVSNRQQGDGQMQFMLDLIWMQSCSRYLASMGKQEARQ